LIAGCHSKTAKWADTIILFVILDTLGCAGVRCEGVRAKKRLNRQDAKVLLSTRLA
jgi:hypothetical protein